jgi:type VI secretion system protein ImpF
MEPRTKTEVPASGWDQVKAYKDGLARDLTNLLNVQRNDDDIPEEFTETNRSVAAYGIRDYSRSPMDTEQIRRLIERSVRIFEPRLRHITVQLIQTIEHRIEFRILATLQLSTRSEPVVFDAILPEHSRRFQVTGGR